MFAFRYAWIIKPGFMDKALELCKEWAHKGLFGDDSQIRCYTPDLSPNLFVIEFVHESDEARNKANAELGAKPESKEFWEEWWALAERWVGNERWNVTELG